MQRIRCWVVREQFAYGEDDIRYFTSQELAKEFYDFTYNDYIMGLGDIKEEETDGGICVFDYMGDFVYSISIYEGVIKIYDEKFW